MGSINRESTLTIDTKVTKQNAQVKPNVDIAHVKPDGEEYVLDLESDS